MDTIKLAKAKTKDGMVIYANGSRLSDLLECSICLIRMKRPLQLTCGHTFCSECIDKLALSGQVLCPECRQATKIPPGGLSINFQILKVISVFEQSNQDLILSCHNCGNPVVGNIHFLCKSCRKDFLCATCCLRWHKDHEVEERRYATREEILDARVMVDAKVATSLHDLYAIEELWDFSVLHGTLIAYTDEMFEAYQQIASKLHSGSVFYDKLTDATNKVMDISDMFSLVRAKIESRQKEMLASCLNDISDFSKALNNVLIIYNSENEEDRNVETSAVELRAHCSVSY